VQSLRQGYQQNQLPTGSLSIAGFAATIVMVVVVLSFFFLPEISLR
tara:strand:+ start:19810 stop:19947 length:138 start_codon:yes stop_codon:yes gene_type:complete